MQPSFLDRRICASARTHIPKSQAASVYWTFCPLTLETQSHVSDFQHFFSNSHPVNQCVQTYHIIRKTPRQRILQPIDGHLLRRHLFAYPSVCLSISTYLSLLLSTHPPSHSLVQSVSPLLASFKAPSVQRLEDSFVLGPYPPPPAFIFMQPLPSSAVS